MSFPSLFFYLFIVQFAGLCVFAAVNDVKFYKLPNKIIFMILILFVPMAVICMDMDQITYHLMGAAVVLTVGFILFALNIFGAGDAKFLTVVSLWAGPDLLPVLLLTMGLVGGAMGAISLLRNRYDVSFVMGYLHLKKLENVTEKLKLPYGVAISAGALTVSVIQISHVAKNSLNGLGG